MAQKRLSHLLAAVIIFLAAGLIAPVSPASADIVDATISVGKGPSGVAINPAGTYAYVTNYQDNTMSRISLATNTVDATISVGNSPSGVAINPAGTYAYVTNNLSGQVSRINLATNTVGPNVVWDGVLDTAISPAGTFAIVTINSPGQPLNTPSLARINLDTMKVDKLLGWLNKTNSVVINRAGTFAYVTNTLANLVYRVNLAVTEFDETIIVGNAPTELALHPAGTFAYVSNSGSNSLSRINLATNKVDATIIVGFGPQGIVIDPSGTFAYVTNGNSGTVSKVNLATNKVDSTITVGEGPSAVAINRAGTFVYVTNSYSNTVSRISLTTAVPVVTTTTTAVPVVTTTLVPNVSTAQFFMDFSVRWSPSWRVVAIYAGLPAPTSARYSVRVITRETCRTYLGYIEALEDGMCTVQVTVRPKVGKSQTKIISFLMETLEQ